MTALDADRREPAAAPSPGTPRQDSAPTPAEPRAHLRVRVTARGLLLAIVAVGLIVLAGLTGLSAARALGVALILLIVLSLLLAVILMPRLRPRVAVIDDAVAAGERARLRIALDSAAPVSRWAFGRGLVHLDLPEALGGPGNVPLAPDFLCAVPVRRRGRHVIGRARVELRDLFAIVRISRRIPVGAVAITGLPRVETAPDLTIRRAGLSRDAPGRSSGTTGGGDISPQARLYVPGDDVRRINWRASARTGRLMTREEEPVESETALVLLDTHRSSPVDDRLIDLAASTVEALASHQWEVRVLDADGEEITRSARRRPGRSVIGAEADAVASRGVALSLADVDFGDEVTAGPAGGGTGSPAGTPSRGRGGRGVGGHVALVVTLLPDDEESESVRVRFGHWGGPGARRVDVLVHPATDDAGGRGRRTGAAEASAGSPPGASGTTGGAAPAPIEDVPGSGPGAEDVQPTPGGVLVRCSDQDPFLAIVTALGAHAPQQAWR